MKKNLNKTIRIRIAIRLLLLIVLMPFTLFSQVEPEIGDSYSISKQKITSSSDDYFIENPKGYCEFFSQYLSSDICVQTLLVIKKNDNNSKSLYIFNSNNIYFASVSISANSMLQNNMNTYETYLYVWNKGCTKRLSNHKWLNDKNPNNYDLITLGFIDKEESSIFNLVETVVK